MKTAAMSDKEMMDMFQVPDLDVIIYQLKNEGDCKINAELLQTFVQKLTELGLISNMPDPVRWIKLQYQFIRLLKILDNE